MTADDVAADQRDVAGLQVVRDAVFLARDSEVVGRDRFYIEAVVAQVVRIPLAAAALRVFVKRHVAAIRRGPGAQRDHARGPADQPGTAGPADQYRQNPSSAQ